MNSLGRFVFVFIVWTCLLELDPAAPWYTNLTASGPKPCPDCKSPSSASATSQVRGSRELLPQWRSREGCADCCQDQWNGVRHLLGFCLPFLWISAVLKGPNISYKTLSLLSTAPPQLCLVRAQFNPLSFQTMLSHAPSLFCFFSRVSLLSLQRRAYAGMMLYDDTRLSYFPVCWGLSC